MTATSDRGIRHTQWDHFIIILVLFTLQRWDPELLSESREYWGREKRNNESGPQNNCRRHSEFPTKFWAIIEIHYNLGSQSFNLAFERIVFNLSVCLFISQQKLNGFLLAVVWAECSSCLCFCLSSTGLNVDDSSKVLWVSPAVHQTDCWIFNWDSRCGADMDPGCV